MKELVKLQNTVDSKKRAIEVGVDEMEDGIKVRDVLKRKVLLSEMKKLLAQLNEVDKSVVRGLKGEAFDHLRVIGRISDEIGGLKASLSDASNCGSKNFKEDVEKLKEKVKGLDTDEFTECLKISVEIHPSSLMSCLENIADSVVLESPFLNSKSLSLDLHTDPEVPHPNYLGIKIVSSDKFSALLLKKTIITMTDGHGQRSTGARVLEECSVAEKVEKEKAKISEDGKVILIQFKKPSTAVVNISVHLLGSNIINSPITYEVSSMGSIKDTAGNNLSYGNDSIGIFDMTGADLEMTVDTVGQKMIFPPGKQNLLSNPPYHPSPNYGNKKGRPLMESVVPSKLNDTTPFNPNPSRASTMKATITASNLAGALSKMRDQGEDKDVVLSEHSSNKIDESELSILAPRKTSASIDEMQRSLSGSESGAGDKSAMHLDKSARQLNRSAMNLDKSVTFAPQTQVVEVLATPQVSASNGNARFLVAQGQTKPGDGRQGQHVRRLNIDDKEIDIDVRGDTDGIWEDAEVDEEHVDEEYETSNTSCLPPILEAAEQSCFFPSEESLLEDPHLMLNASKVPTPQKSWPKADSVWDSVDIEHDGQDIIEDYRECDIAAVTLPITREVKDSEFNKSCLRSYYEDPHLMLNASKAPSPQSDWSKEDSIWDWGFEQSPTKVSSEDFNHTMWEIETETKRHNKFDLKKSFEIDDIYETHAVTSSSRRGTQYCLVSPHSIAYHQGVIIVTEPDMNRVGCYLDQGFRFYCWFSYPKQFSKTRQQYNYPTSILALANTCLVLLERDRLHIYASSGVPIQCIRGEYSGLSEGTKGEIFTLGKNNMGQPVVVKFEKFDSSYKVTGQVVITTVQEFENWEVLSKTSCLLYNKGKIYITDEGLHKLYIIDLQTKDQIARGYLGSKPGQFRRPTGLLADDLGNILVSDSDNNRFLVFTEEGKFLKVAQQVDATRLVCPQGMIRKHKEVLAVFRGGKEGIKGAVVKFKESGDSGVSIPDEGSE